MYEIGGHCEEYAMYDSSKAANPRVEDQKDRQNRSNLGMRKDNNRTNVSHDSNGLITAGSIPILFVFVESAVNNIPVLSNVLF